MRSLEKNNKCCSIYINSRVSRKNWVIRESKKILGFSGVNRTASWRLSRNLDPWNCVEMLETDKTRTLCRKDRHQTTLQRRGHFPNKTRCTFSILREFEQTLSQVLFHSRGDIHIFQCRKPPLQNLAHTNEKGPARNRFSLVQIELDKVQSVSVCPLHCQHGLLCKFKSLFEHCKQMNWCHRTKD